MNLTASTNYREPRGATWSRAWILIGIVAALVALPLIGILAAALGTGNASDTAQTWRNFLVVVLPSYVASTVLLAIGVALATMALGTGAAWLIERYEFPFRRTFAWMMMLPLAIPAYVSAYAVTDFLAFAGPAQTFLRRAFNWSKSDYWFPDFHSVGGGIAIFTLSLYPYVYFLARDAFAERGTQLVDAARTLGLSARQAFWRVALPVARPAIVGGAMLAVMETLADYGAVSYLGIDTLSVGIFRSWFNMGDKAAAAQLSLLLLTAVAIVVAIELRNRARARYAGVRGASGAHRERLQGARAWRVAALCAIPVMFGFIGPLFLLLRLFLHEGAGVVPANFASVLIDSLRLAASAAAIAVALALALGLLRRRLARTAGSTAHTAALSHRGLSLGYAVPGAVLAVGLLTPFAFFDRAFGSLLFTGTMLAVLIGCVIRFYGIAANNIDAALARLPLNVDDATRAMGVRGWEAFRRVFAPILKPSLGTAALLVFVDTLKELPATLSLRPFNFDTLATLTYTLTKDERLAEAVVPSLLIVAISAVPIILLNRKQR